MKLYGDFTKKDWLKVFGVEENQNPLSFMENEITKKI